MNIDVTALKAVERERGIPADTVLEAIETALVTAYRHADGAAKHVRVHVDRKSGEVAVLAQELGPDGEVVREWDDTPTDFGRIAASTAKQVIVQRLRDAEHEQTFGEYAGKEGDIVSGIVQAHDRRNVQGTVLIDIGKVEAVLSAGRAGARRGVHARQPDQGLRRVGGPHVPGAAGDRLPHPPEPGPQAVRPRGARDRRRQRRDRRGGPRGRAPVEDRRPHEGARAQRQGRLHRADGPAGAQRDERAARREDRHRRLVRRPRHVRGLGAEPGAGHQRHGRRPAAKAVRVVVPDYQLSLAIGKEGQNARLAARLTGCRIDIRSDAQVERGGRCSLPGCRPCTAACRASPVGVDRGRPPASRSSSAAHSSPTRGTSRSRHALECRVAETSTRYAPVWGPETRSGQRTVACRHPARGPGPGSPSAAPRKGGVRAPRPGVSARSGATPGVRQALRLPGGSVPVEGGLLRDHVLGASSEVPAERARAGEQP